jgi:DNA-binding transcriptional ArsR family regulator
MVNQQQSNLDLIFSALADPTRRAILQRLTRGEATVTELAEPFDVSLPAISKQLGVLEHAGLIVRDKDGRTRRCKLVAQPMINAAQWLSQYRAFWEDQFDALEEFLNELPDEGSENKESFNDESQS